MQQHESQYQSRLPANEPRPAEDFYSSLSDVEATFEREQIQQMQQQAHFATERSHKIKVFRDQVHACDICGKLYASQKDVDRHKLLRHWLWKACRKTAV